MKKLLLFIGVFLPLFVSGQLNYTGKAFRSIMADSATVRTETVGLELMYDSVGVMYYNRQASPGKWRCYTTFRGWYDCGTGSGGGSSVNIYNSDGTLSGNRLLDADNNTLSFDNVQSFDVQTPSGESAFFMDVNQINIFRGDDGIELDGSSISLTFDATSDLLLDGDPGTATQVLTSNGNNLPPTWEDAATGSTISQVSASTAGGTITLDLNSLDQRMFYGSASFATAKVLALSNDTNAKVFTFFFTVTNVAGTVEYPAGWLMQDSNFNGTLWTPPATGVYEMSGTFNDDSNVWYIKVIGPYL